MIDEYVLRITGGAPLMGPIETEQRFRLTDGELECYSVEKKDNQDGTYTLVYKARYVSAVELDQAGNKISGKDKTKMSVQMRRAFENERLDDARFSDMSAEDYYQMRGKQVLANLELIFNLLDQRYE